MITPPDVLRAASPWRCPGCEAERAAEDDFCGRCGTRRPVAEPTGDAAAATGRFPLVRALALNGVILGAVLLAFVLGRGDGGPTTIAFEPTLWRCDGSDRAWIAAVPASAPDVRLDWMTGGPAGQVLASSSTNRAALEPYRQPDGTFRVATADPDAPECGLASGVYTLAIRDAASNVLIASGTVELAP
ncbi:MAG TPA: hypothetical protein VES19_09705 [Candidatus Limnocylindrales bacterium]|nr:hypothetical protein [Candidatus Limnocylindrales bacterium]